MSDDRTKISLGQMPVEDIAARAVREKIGDAKEIVGDGISTVLEGFTTPDQKRIREEIIAIIQTIFDPEIPLNVYDLGLIYKMSMDATSAVHIEMTLTAPGCPVAAALVEEVRSKVDSHPEIPTATVELVWEPAWTRDRLSEAARLELGML